MTPARERSEPEQEPLARISEVTLDREPPGRAPASRVAVGRLVVEQQLVVVNGLPSDYGELGGDVG